MVVISPKNLVKLLEDNLMQEGIDYKKEIQEGDNFSAIERRIQGENFSFREHIKGLILALLSSNRPWKPIQEKLAHIEEIFSGYDSDYIQRTSPKKLTQKIRKIKCGNKSISKQMESLSPNIDTLRRIELTYSSLDNFVLSNNLEITAKAISDPKSEYKLRQVGFALAIEYLKNVGIDGIKPDRHLLRIGSHERLGLFEENMNQTEVSQRFREIAKQASVPIVYLDNLIFFFAAEGYGEICGAKPKCNNCLLTDYCNYS